MELKNKTYTILQKIVMGIITFIFVGVPILIWIWVFNHLITHE